MAVRLIALSGSTLLVFGLLAKESAGGPPTLVDYNRQVRPILSNHCFQCHGPDAEERQSDLRLDVREEALKPAESGKPAIVPGEPGSSGLVARIFSTRPGVVMPPPESHKTLKPEEKQVLKDWVAQGAPYQTHWSFRPVTRPRPPEVKDPAWSRNAIDVLILARLEAEGLRPSAEADRPTLIRRLTLDLTGLPPTPTEVDDFRADRRPDAYERLVDRLLSSPRYGERMTLDWLDAARYADTHGYHIDSGRDMTRWRDWVIDAFNTNLPFDAFTVEQIAGDLLPNATTAQKIASGFHRNHMISFEGGAIPEEYQTAYIVDRVNTTGTVWLGLTIGCTQCHDHKFDPLTQKDYYSLYAFFNNVPEKGLDGAKGNASPVIKLPTPTHRAETQRLAERVRDAERKEKAGEKLSGKETVESLRRELALAEERLPSVMVMEELPRPRDTFLLTRGQYDKRGEKVSAAVPAFLPPLPDGTRADRLALARWLVDPRHPLVGRVVTNRFWQTFFGVGIVRTSEDFGSQGEAPSHPELLDWLASEFVSGSDKTRAWDVKSLVRQIVTSSTYRQSSVASPAHQARDPENRLLAHGPRVRLPAEFIRDQALAVSGLLNGEIGGASVSPYQPPGLWEELMSRSDGKNWSAQTYVQSHGKDLYRRTMYTFWKRTSPPPSLATFDAPDRETCTVRRARTNTPLQALVLMNDPTYVEAARKLAERVMTESQIDPTHRIALAFRLATARQPAAGELAILREVYDADLSRFRHDPKAAEKLLGVGESSRDRTKDPAELAAFTTVASVILNLDEVLNKN